MKKVPMTLQSFRKYMKNIKESCDFIEVYNDLLHKYGAEGYISFPDCVDAVIELLSYIFGDEDDWIGYFIFELEFGKRYVEGMVTREDGTNIPLATTDDLYRLLTEDGDEK